MRSKESGSIWWANTIRGRHIVLHALIEKKACKGFEEKYTFPSIQNAMGRKKKAEMEIIWGGTELGLTRRNDKPIFIRMMGTIP